MTGRAPILPTYSTPRSPDRYTDGPAAGRLIARKTGRITTRWQQHVLDVGLERVDGPDSPFAYSTVDTIAGRRTGKTITLMGVPLFRGLCGPVTLDNGVVVPFIGGHTAQNLSKAQQRFQKDMLEPFQASMTPSAWEAGQKFRSQNGDMRLTFDPAVQGKDWRSKRASEFLIFAPVIGAVRGDGMLHLSFDEVLVHTAQRGLELMAAARPTLATLRGHGQIWRSSNVTMLNDARTWLAVIRDRGRAAVKAGKRTGQAYFEFTIPDDADPTDESTWWEHYPGLADGLLRPEELRGDMTELGVDHFAAEYLGRWPGKTATILWGVFLPDEWEGAGTVAEQPDGVAGVGVDVDPFGRSSSLTSVVDDVVEVIDHRPGSDWVFDRVVEVGSRADVVAIGVDDYGPGHDLLGRLQDVDGIADKLVPTRSTDFVAACYGFEAGVREGAITWRRSDFHQVLTSAVSAAQRTAGRSWQWERRVSVSQTPLVAATLARWALAHRVDSPEPEIF